MTELKQIVKPNIFQSISFVIISCLILIATHFSLIINRLFGKFSIGQEELQLIVDDVFAFDDYFQNINQSEIAYAVAIGLFWVGIGLLIYASVWVLFNILVEVKNLIVYETYYINKASLKDRFLVFFWRIILALSVVGIVIITTLYGLPLWFTMFGRFIFSDITLLNTLYLVGSVTGMSANLYLIYVTGKVFFWENS